MKILFLTIIFAAAVLTASAQSNDNEETLVRVPLENYLKGHATGDGAYMVKAFYPTAKIEGIREGKLSTWTLEEYVKFFDGKASPEEPKRRRWIESVEITGHAAVAKLMFDYPEAKITDYLLLLKIDGAWKIVNKIYQGERKTPPAK